VAAQVEAQAALLTVVAEQPVVVQEVLEPLE
jgi:hypothetical protein